MKCSFGISYFLEEIPSVSHSVVFLYFFALIAKEGFLSFVISIEFRKCDASNFAFLSQDGFNFSRSFVAPHVLAFSFSIFVGKCHRNFDRGSTESVDHLGNMGIFFN